MQSSVDRDTGNKVRCVSMYRYLLLYNWSPNTKLSFN